LGVIRSLLLLALCLPLSVTALDIAPTEPQDPESQRLQFHLPPGFEIQLVLADPDIGQPMNLSFDAQGRLWVTSSVEYPYPVQGEGIEPRFEKTPGVGEGLPKDWLTVASNIGPDGRPASIQRFATGLNIPIGQTPMGDGSEGIVYSIPDISRFRDVDGDGHAEIREPLYRHFGNIDTHGMANSFRRWIDGWIYGSHGFRNTSQIVDDQGRTTELYSGHTYRFRPDGSRFEIYTRGQVNPFGLTIDPLGNVFSADCHSRPLFQLLQGAAYLRPSWGQPIDEPLGLAPEMIDHDHGSTGICGPAYYAADYFPAEYRDNIFLCNPVTGRIHRDKLIQHGSTLLADTQPDFITCDDPWFRPVDLTVGPDGALYLADFYNAIIGHYEVPLNHEKRDRTHGRVWRIIYKKPPPPIPDLTQLETDSLLRLLETENEPLRVLANLQLGDRWEAQDEDLVREFYQKASPHARAHILWILERNGSLSDEELDAAIRNESYIVQVHAQKILAERQSWEAKEKAWALFGLQASNGFVSRAAADGMRRHPDASFINPLLTNWETADAADTHLIHVIRMALREQLRHTDGWSAKLSADSPLVGIAAVTHTVESARFALLKSDPRQDHFKTALEENVSLLNEEELRGLINRLEKSDFNREETIRMLGAVVIGLEADPSSELLNWALKAIANVFENPRSVDRSILEFAMGIAGALELKELADPLLAMARDGDLAACQAILQIDPEQGFETMLELLAVAPAARQTELARVISSTEPGSVRLLDAIEEGSASSFLLRDSLIRQNLGETNPRLVALTKNLPDESAELSKLLQERRVGFPKAKRSIENGRIVFQTYCVACHSIDGGGGNIGPSLDGAYVRGFERLLEDILEPNRNVDPAFTLTTLRTRGGQNISGIGARSEAGQIILMDAAGTTHTIAEAEVTEKTNSHLSLMPAGLGTLIPQDDLFNLVEFLSANREGKASDASTEVKRDWPRTKHRRPHWRRP
jgi:putative heme-binding domain-containing protein